MRNRLASLTMPVLLINRADDALSPEAKTQWLAEHLPNSAGHRIVPGGERFFMYAEAETVNQLIEQFLASVHAPASKHQVPDALVAARGTSTSPSSTPDALVPARGTGTSPSPTLPANVVVPLAGTRRSVGDIVVGFWMLSHIEPIVLILTVVTLFAVRASWPHPAWITILLLLAGQAAMQFSIGILNDYCDRHLDAAGRKNKPIVLGLIRPHEALLAGLFMIV